MRLEVLSEKWAKMRREVEDSEAKIKNGNGVKKEGEAMGDATPLKVRSDDPVLDAVVSAGALEQGNAILDSVRVELPHVLRDVARGAGKSGVCAGRGGAEEGGGVQGCGRGGPRGEGDCGARVGSERANGDKLA